MIKRKKKKLYKRD